MTLDIDIGNTRVKWRSSLQPESIEAFVLGDPLPEVWRTLPPRRIRISSVVSPVQTAAFAAALRAHCGVEPEIAAVKNHWTGLALAYEDTARLGVDRWLAMLAAQQRFSGRNLVVVSAGTALTADLVDASQTHRGGFIAPGLQNAAFALAQNAQGLAASRWQITARWRPGTTTLECVDAGFTLLYHGFCIALRAQVQEILGESQWLFTGGDAEHLHRLWSGAAKLSASNQILAQESISPLVLPGAVLDGLAVALP